MGIREKYARKKLHRKEAETTRKAEIPDLKTIKKVGIIWQPEGKEALQYLQDYFNKKQIIVRSLCVYEDEAAFASETNSITPKDLDWLGIPKNGKINNFAEIQYDVLMNITLKQNITLDYITLVTRAKFKIGWSLNEKNYFDLNINIDRKKNELYLAKQQIFYLGQLNKKQ